MGKFRDIIDTVLDLRQEGGNLLELLEPEQGVAGCVLVQHKMWSHRGSA